MTAKMLTRQATKAHKESEVQKAKVKKVSNPNETRMKSNGRRRFSKGIMILRGSMLGMLFERNRNG